MKGAAEANAKKTECPSCGAPYELDDWGERRCSEGCNKTRYRERLKARKAFSMFPDFTALKAHEREEAAKPKKLTASERLYGSLGGAEDRRTRRG